MRKLTALLALILSAASLPANAALVVDVDNEATLQGSFSYSIGESGVGVGLTNRYIPTDFRLLPFDQGLYGLRQSPGVYSPSAHLYTNFFGTEYVASGDLSYFWVTWSDSSQSFDATDLVEGKLMGSYYAGPYQDVEVFFRFYNLLDSGGGDGTFTGNFCFSTSSTTCSASTPVPLPAAAWLLLSGLGGLGFVGRRRKAA